MTWKQYLVQHSPQMTNAIEIVRPTQKQLDMLWLLDAF